MDLCEHDKPMFEFSSLLNNENISYYVCHNWLVSNISILKNVYIRVKNITQPYAIEVKLIEIM